MTTARQLIYSSLRLIQVVDQGEESSDLDIESGALLALQMLISSWSTRELLSFTTIVDQYSLIANKDSFTIGPLGDLVVETPESIANVYISTSNNIDITLYPISQTEYYSIINKQYSSNSYKYYYYQFGYPNGTFYMFPIPSTSGDIITISSYKNYTLDDSISIDSLITLPSPYLNALKYNLAIELASEYATEVSMSVAVKAKETLDGIVRLCQKKVPQAQFDFGNSPYSHNHTLDFI